MRYWIDFKKLREELSFEKIFEQYSVKLHTKGEQATGPCPLPGHTGDRKTDSFSANIPKGIFQCFSCHAKGNVLDFAVLMERRNPESGNDLRQTGIELAKRYGLQNVGSEQKARMTRANGVTHVRNNDRPPVSNARANSMERESGGTHSPKREPFINSPLPFTLRELDPKHPYLTDRGLTPETIRQFGLGFCSKGRLNGRIAIPIHDRKTYCRQCAR
jgi:DNA primase